MDKPGWYREDESGAMRYWDGGKWQEQAIPPRPRHPDFQPSDPPANERRILPALVVTAVLSTAVSAISLGICATSPGHDHASHSPAVPGVLR